MKEYTENIRHEISNTIQTIESTNKDLLPKREQIISAIGNSLKQLKSFIIKYEFKNPNEEILFFKEIKPQIHSQLLFYTRIYNIEKKLKTQSKSMQISYLNNELLRLNEFSCCSREFEKYYRMNSTNMDHVYFTRDNNDTISDSDCLFIDRDPLFSTGYDYEVANIITGDLLKIYIKEKLEILKNDLCNNIISVISEEKLHWTDSKVSLIELIYGIQASGSVNQGKVDLKNLVICFEAIFNIEIGDFYRTFLEIRDRKKSRTQYIDRMKEGLIIRMDKLDS